MLLHVRWYVNKKGLSLGACGFVVATDTRKCLHNISTAAPQGSFPSTHAFCGALQLEFIFFMQPDVQLARIKATVIRHLSEDIASAIQSTETVANRCWRKKVISDDIYRAVLRNQDPQIKHTTLLEAVEAGIRANEEYFEVFLEILKNELEPEIAKSLIPRIHCCLEEETERVNIDQSTEEDPFPSMSSSHSAQYEAKKQESQKEKGMVKPSENSDASGELDNNKSTSSDEDNSTSTSSVASLRRRAISQRSSQTDEEPPHITNEPTEVVSVQATAELPSSEERAHQRREMIRQAQEERFAHYDKIQQDARCRELMKEKEKVEKELEEQSVDFYNVCEERKSLENMLKEKTSEVESLKTERDQIVARHRIELEELRSKVANNERERNNLQIKCQELEKKISKMTTYYDTEISQHVREIQSLQEKLLMLKNTIGEQEEKINELKQEKHQLCRCVFKLQNELNECRREVLEFKSNLYSLIIFLVVFRGMFEFMLIAAIYLYFSM